MKRIIVILLLGLTSFSGATLNAAPTPAPMQTETSYAAVNEAPNEYSVCSDLDNLKPKAWRKVLRWIRWAIDWLDDHIPYEAIVNDTPDGGTLPGQINILYDLVDDAEAQALGITVTDGHITFNQPFKVMETQIKTASIPPGTYPVFQNEYGEPVANVNFIVRDK